MVERCIWPDIILHPNIEFMPDLDENDRLGAALAAQATAWANCMGRQEPPSTFGEGMMVLSRITGVSLPREVSVAIERWLAVREYGGLNT